MITRKTFEYTRICGSRGGPRGPAPPPFFELSYRLVKTCLNRIFPISSLSLSFFIIMFCNSHFELCFGIFIFLKTNCFEIRIFYNSSPKRQTALEDSLTIINSQRKEKKLDEIKSYNTKTLCETRWVERHTKLCTFETHL